MTDEEFALGVDAILTVPVKGHAQHRALDLWWTRYAIEKGGALEDATRKWMAAIEGDHKKGPYPLGRRWWQFWIKRPKPAAEPSEFGNWTCP